MWETPVYIAEPGFFVGAQPVCGDAYRSTAMGRAHNDADCFQGESPTACCLALVMFLPISVHAPTLHHCEPLILHTPCKLMPLLQRGRKLETPKGEMHVRQDVQAPPGDSRMPPS